MTPLTTKPAVVILLAPKGDEVMAVASNIAPVTVATVSEDPLTIKLTRKMGEFNEAAANKPFNSTAPLVQPVLASKK
jgi:hypothetical protein